jgi:protein-disulfide isomerase
MSSRRQILEAFGLIGLSAVLPSSFAFGQAAKENELKVPGALGDVFLGQDDAKVTIIEYASMTCPHCAHFHTTTFPALKQKYIDTGKVRFTLREFPFDPLAVAGFMLARCNGNDKYYAMVDLLFTQQKAWVGTPNPSESLSATVKQAGFTQESFEACLKNQAIYDAVNAVRDRGEKVFGVDSTPTFFINGQKQSGALSIEELDKLLAPLLGG